MILHMGIRTTEPMRVAYRLLKAQEDDATSMANFLTTLVRKGAVPTDTTMFVYHEPSVAKGQRRELQVPIACEVEGVETKALQPTRVAFIVYTGAGSRMEEQHRRLLDYMGQSNLKPAGKIDRIEVHYAPEDMDEKDWTMEIMIPLQA